MISSSREKQESWIFRLSAARLCHPNRRKSHQARLARTGSTRTERGQSLAEMTMVTILLLILVAGIVDLGRAFFYFMALRDAVQEGAVYGSINPTLPVEIKNHVLGTSELVAGIITSDDINVEIIGKACTGNSIRVTATYDDFKITMPFLGTLIGKQTVPIRASVIDTILSPACK